MVVDSAQVLIGGSLMVWAAYYTICFNSECICEQHTHGLFLCVPYTFEHEKNVCKAYRTFQSTDQQPGVLMKFNMYSLHFFSEYEKRCSVERPCTY